MPCVYHVIPFFVELQCFEPKMVRILRLRQDFTVVAPKVFWVNFLILEHVVKLSVSVCLRIVVHPWSVDQRELQIWKFWMSHSAKIRNILIDENRLSEWLI